MGICIRIIGFERGDIPYYIGKSFASNGKSVALVDNSFSKDLFESVHHYRDEDYGIEKESILYLKDCVITDSFKDKFDYIIEYYGMTGLKSEADFTFVIATYDAITLAQINSEYGDEFAQVFFLFIEKASNKVSEKSIMHQYQLQPDQILGYIPIDSRDANAYVSFTYEGRQRISALSEDMQLAIKTFITIITGETLKEVEKYYKKAKKNKKF